MLVYTFVSIDAVAIFEMMHFILIPDSTFNTNVLGLPLLVFVSINNYGRSYIIGCSFMARQDGVCYRLAFETFYRLTKLIIPGVIISDQEAALINAISEIYRAAPRQLCCFHLKKNVCEAFGARKEAIDLFWRIACCIDVGKLAEHFEALRKLAQTERQVKLVEKLITL